MFIHTPGIGSGRRSPCTLFGAPAKRACGPLSLTALGGQGRRGQDRALKSWHDPFDDQGMRLGCGVVCYGGGGWIGM